MLTRKRNLLDEIRDLVEEDIEVLRNLLEEDTEALKLTVNPEKIIGRPMNQWNENDFKLIQQVYGDSDKIKRFATNQAKERLIKLESLNE